MPVKANPGGKDPKARIASLPTEDAVGVDEREQQMFLLADIFADIFESLQDDCTPTTSGMEEAA